MLNAEGETIRKPTPSYYIKIALLPWNIGMYLGTGLMVAAGVVRFRRASANTAPAAADTHARDGQI
ncbi:hypothetical protein DES53_11548 [Roseimicrobium gellanilyticum]|uniref:Uncharacterized protein n=1 Tax=Roseimicrobium gellanilyticum TaxID=748857 RepID=A0A366H671_9BACT|nr:hypothetical protein DES53_11548 [Roseimicrobium gellanilyticum]